ncbi:hypothetical protein GCM10017600_00110 [Streptosporangium carneum]|uniref:Uncharacterized protein n=1 Tax=Streptosporangium carneum TaxID=47481 RepID=A0A9W6HVL3_9ACTN|nr:hypothetical protein GCM10017600_00110 [Streptosporangium carneum]
MLDGRAPLAQDQLTAGGERLVDGETEGQDIGQGDLGVGYDDSHRWAPSPSNRYRDVEVTVIFP